MTPEYTQVEVKRLIIDLFPDKVEFAQKIVGSYDGLSSELNRAYIQSVCLELSEGDMTRLQKYIEFANMDCRDVLVEYEKFHSD